MFSVNARYVLGKLTFAPTAIVLRPSDDGYWLMVCDSDRGPVVMRSYGRARDVPEGADVVTQGRVLWTVSPL